MAIALSLFAQEVEPTKSSQKCDNCDRRGNIGPGDKCMVVDHPLINGACTNCYYLGLRSSCSFVTGKIYCAVLLKEKTSCINIVGV
ncbi:hypothetical protein QBC37DRAFT_289482 [Rhypophila decipiens]|uniref:Uncharacterized protein n=1 Tax=Rhypophila decipiens TaxID=261697 RepID=A0AAN6Y4Q2_9PEZI|nr:hypothetical protein QBC37DRAFT_289482 [Rhypophila decipiens]